MEWNGIITFFHRKSNLPFTHIRIVMWPSINRPNIILQMRLCQTHTVWSLFKIIEAIRVNRYLQIESDKYCNLGFYCRPFNQKHRSFMTQQADTSDDRVVIMALQKLEAHWTVSGVFRERVRWVSSPTLAISRGMQWLALCEICIFTVSDSKVKWENRYQRRSMCSCKVQSSLQTTTETADSDPKSARDREFFLKKCSGAQFQFVHEIRRPMWHCSTRNFNLTSANVHSDLV